MDLRNLLRRGDKKTSDERKSTVQNMDPPGELFGAPPRIPNQPIELGTIEYCNITNDGKHGDYATVVQLAAETGKPIFVNFVEWSGWQGCKDAGRVIFSNPIIKAVAERYFVPAAFNTWDQSKPQYAQAFRAWSAGLSGSWWGYLRIVSSSGKEILTGTRQITGGHGLKDVQRCICEALEELGEEIPRELLSL